jgi:purine-nucleoside phosphorylase
MLLSDHINYSGLNPLIGEKTDARFVPMTDAHDPAMRRALEAAAVAQDIDLPKASIAGIPAPRSRLPPKSAC